MNDPMTVLRAEHEVITAAGGVIGAMDTASASYDDVLRRLISFFVSYSDGFHHRKEEVALFPALRSHPEFYLHGLLDELEEHHQTFRDRIARMQSALSEKNYDGAQSELSLYFNELLDHIAVENDELFVMAESLFSDAELERLYFAFQDVDHELGNERKKELEAGVKSML
jgi:hemerythrin-like domain-containing protein